MEFLSADGRVANGVVALPTDHFAAPFPEPSVDLFLNGTLPPPPIFAPCKRRRSVRPRCARNLTPLPAEPSSGDLGLLAKTLLTAANDVAPTETSPIQLQFKPQTDAQFTNIISQVPTLEAELLSESSEGEKENDNERGESKKQKFALFLEDMVRKVMDKQEKMHKQLIELMEKKEQERILREEDWKRKEIERAKKDAELRSQQMSRSLALLSFLKNLVGSEIQIPSSDQLLSCPEEDENNIHGQRATYDSINKRWPKVEVQALITVRLALDDKFQYGHKGPMWEEVAARLANMGYNRTPRKCKEKWENINKYYKKMTNSVTSCTKVYKSCPYFRELDMLYSKGIIAPVTKNDGEDVECIGSSFHLLSSCPH